MKEAYKCRNPVLLKIFRRPNQTRQVMAILREVRPDKLYVSGDGPSGISRSEVDEVMLAREIALNPGWDCEVVTKFSSQNLGGARCSFEGQNWFFANEEQGIVLEDDNLPSIDFFKFCDELLDYYKYEPKIFAITGNNFQAGRWRGTASYYFSSYPHCWGWATWRRAWRHSSLDIRFWLEWKVSKEWNSRCDDRVFKKYWENIFDSVANGTRVHWDYAWTATCWFKSGAIVTPNVNLVSNIGFGPSGTTTLNSNSALANIPAKRIGYILHPDDILIDSEADRYVFNSVFGGKYRRFPWILVYLPCRLSRLVYRKFKRMFA